LPSVCNFIKRSLEARIWGSRWSNHIKHNIPLYCFYQTVVDIVLLSLVSFHFVSFRWFRFVSFRFVSFLFRFTLYRYPEIYAKNWYNTFIF
jgi:hypothetical protein